MTSKAHDFIKLFNAIESVRGGLVAHPQDTRSTLSLSLSHLLTPFGGPCRCFGLGGFLL
jgi:hypothetical protein